MKKGDGTSVIQLDVQQAAYLRAFVSVAMEFRFFRDHIDDEAQEVIGAAVQEIGRQLVRMQYPEGLLWEDMFPLLFIPRVSDLLEKEEEDFLRDTFAEIH